MSCPFFGPNVGRDCVNLRKMQSIFFYFLATGEPALCMAFVAVIALRNALNSARKDAGIDEWFTLGKYIYICVFLI